MSTITEMIIVAHAAGETRDATIIALVSGHGLSLNAATKRYAEVAKTEGWTTGRESRKTEALAWLATKYGTAWDADAVRAAVVELADEFAVQDSTARDYCRAYSEQLGVEHPVEDPRAAMFGHLVATGAVIDPSDVDAIDAAKAAFKAYAGEDGLGRSPSNVNEYWKGFELAMAIVARRES